MNTFYHIKTQKSRENKALSKPVKSKKNWRGRFQVCKRSPLMIDKIERDIYNIIVLDKIIFR